APDRRRDQDELSDELRMPEGDEERDAAAQRVAHDVGPLELEVLDERGDVFGHQLGADRSIDVGRSAVSLQVRGDDLTALRERRKVGAEHRNRAEASVEQDERMPRSLDLVVELDAVDIGVMAFACFAAPLSLSLALFVGKGDASRYRAHFFVFPRSMNGPPAWRTRSSCR